MSQSAELSDGSQVGGGLGEAWGGLLDAVGEFQRDVERLGAVADELSA